MKYKKYILQVSIIFALLYLTPQESNAQDSLYLIGTITGESYENRITDVKGIGDVNGDGYDDFMVTHYINKAAELYFGSPTLDLIPDVVFHYPESDDFIRYFGISTGIGDVNGDGYNDFTIKGGFGEFLKGKVFLYLGGEEIDTIPINEFYEPWIEDTFGYEVVKIGDINKDGYDDFIITSPYNWSDARGRAYLFWGGDTISWERSITFLGDLFFPQSAANIDDINNDDFNDIAIGAAQSPSGNDTGKVYIYYGGNPMDSEPDTVLVSGNTDDEFGKIIKNAGDLNKNEEIDFCISAYGKFFIYVSGFDNPLTIPGYSIDTGGDINADGFDDIIVGNERKINVYLGSENLDINPDIIIEDSLRYSTQFIYMLWDLNNDGFDEFASFAPNWPNSENPQGKVFIFSYRKIVTVKSYNEGAPDNFKLFQNYPNPFNPSTSIQYTLSNRQSVTLKIFDLLGQEITTLVSGDKLAGEYEIEFDASQYRLSSGIYFYRLYATPIGGQAGKFSETKKMVLLR